MSDTVKLIIEISKEDYDFIKIYGNPRMYGFKAIQNGIPLDDVKVEIANRPYGITNDSVLRGEIYERRAVLRILDNIGRK